MKKIIFSLIAIIMALTMMPSTAYAGSSSNQKFETIDYTWINPEYKNIIRQSDFYWIPYPTMQLSLDDEYITSESAAVDYIRENMVDRNTSFMLYYRHPISEAGTGSGWANELIEDMLDQAFKHTGVPDEGDYLLYQFGGMSISGGVVFYDENYAYFKLPIKAIYYTTASQEATMDTLVDNVLDDIIKDNMSDYEKVKAIYNYITKNVYYDYTHLNNSSYKLKYTAYAALKNKSAVCQGYANLFYRMVLECGIDARIITGTTDLGGHAWNIVEIGNRYYLVDPTWDASYVQAGRSPQYFLYGSYSDHYADSEFKQSSFTTKYPMASKKYEPGVTVAALDQPTNVKVNPVESSGKPRITWNAVSGADKYYVYRATKASGTYEYLGSTTNTYYTNTSATPGKVYYYKVKAVKSSNENANSALSDYGYMTCDLAQPSNVKVNPVESSGKPKVTWSEVDGADRYYVYRATSSGGSYEYLGSTTNTHYTNTGAKAGTCYYYKVKAVMDGNSSAASAISDSCYMTCDLAQPTDVKVNPVESSGKPRVSWTAVSGADKYYVYRTTSSGGTYEYLGSTTNTYYTNTGATVGKTYYYKVKAVYASNESANSAQSSSCSMTCDLAQPTDIKVSNVASSGKPRVTWTAVDKADKYYVYRSTSSSGTFDYLGSTTNTYYTNTGAVAGKTYYYKVKAVYTDNESANSALSSYTHITCDLAQPTGLSIALSSTSGKPKVSWTEVNGADKYYVYRSLSATGTYDYLGSTANLSYTNTGAEAGTTYFYKLKAVDADNEYANSALSTYVTITSN